MSHAQPDPSARRLEPAELPLQPAAARALERWHAMVETADLTALPEIVHADAVFRSPVAHTPYPGRDAVVIALNGALQTFEAFTYHREFATPDGLSAILEFSAEVRGKKLKGIDMIRFDQDGVITEFEVMVRPMSGLTMLAEEMAKRVGAILKATAG